MGVPDADAKNQLSQRIRPLEQGEEIVHTRNDEPLAGLTPAPRKGRKVKWGTMRGRIHTKPGWDAPRTLEQFIGGDF